MGKHSWFGRQAAPQSEKEPAWGPQGRGLHKAPRCAGASPWPSIACQPAQWELSALPSPSLLAVPCSQVRALPLFVFFKINHFWGEFDVNNARGSMAGL